MDKFRTPFANQMFVVSGVLTAILGCGVGLGYMAAFIDSQKMEMEAINQEQDSWLFIETCGEIAFVPAIIVIPLLMQRRGRRIANFATATALLSSWIFSFLSNHRAPLILCNILLNIALGGAVSTSSVIVSEYCSPKLRGPVLMLETAVISLGVLFSHVSAMFSCWNWISCLGLLSSSTSLIITYFWPESPYWLVYKGHIMKCTENYNMLRGYDDDSVKELEALLMTHNMRIQLQSLQPIKVLSIKEKVLECCKTLLKADFLRPLSVMILLFSFIGFGGETIAANISFRDIFNLAHRKYIGTIILDVLTIICSLLACILIQIIKRKTLFIITSSLSLVCLGFVDVLSFLQTKELLSRENLWILLSFSTGFAMFMSLGTTALPFSLLGEIFPMSYKGVGCSLTCAYLWTLGNSVLKSIPQLASYLGMPTLILLATIFMIVLLIVITKIVPETSNMTLLEIQNLVQHSNVNSEYEIVEINEPASNSNFDKLNLLLAV